MKIDRRRFLSLGAGALASTLAPSALARPGRESTASRKQRRLLFNWDGSTIHCWGRAAAAQAEGPLTREAFVALVFGPIDDTPVDTVLFSFGSGNVAEYESRVLEWPGEADRFRFPSSRTWHGGIEVDPADQYRNPKALADAGDSPPAVIVEECHKRGLDAFVSLRMNDCHDGQHPRGTLPNPELPTFKRQNPDWLVGDLDWWSALDFSHPRVRALKLKVIEEFFERWDFDGIEIDWLRHTLYFPRGTERENSRHLTDFMREVRRRLNAIATKRGRPIEVAVRVPEHLEWCLEGGFDVPAWIAGDFVDMLILGQGLTEAPHLGRFRALMPGRRIPLYPCLYSYGNGYRLSPDEVIRGNAANMWRDGADGISTFNWFYRGPWRREILRDIADPARLAAASRHYTLVQRLDTSRGEAGTDFARYNTVVKSAPLPFTLTNAERERSVAIPIAENHAAGNAGGARRFELWVVIDHLRAGDVLDLELNGQGLGRIEGDARVDTVGYTLDIPPGNGVLGFPPERRLDMTFRALRVAVPGELLTKRRNTLTVALLKRATGAEYPLRVSRVELSSRPS